MTPARHCVGCGRLQGPKREAELCDGSCRRALDPPRFCWSCGRRMAVQVTPTGWRGRCRGCGAEVSSKEPTPT